MKIKLFFLLITQCWLYSTWAQSFPGFSGDNFNGTIGLITNPANSADSRIKMDINLFSGNFTGSTDYISLNQKNVLSFLNDFNFENGIPRNTANQNEILANEDYLGPSVLYIIDNLNSVGFFTRFRRYRNYNGVNGQLFENTLQKNFENDYTFSLTNLDTSVHMWGEIGFSYARVLLNEGNHFFKVGATIKYLLGGGSAQSESTQLNGRYNAQLEQIELEGNLSYVTTFENGEPPKLNINSFGINGAFDVGFVYEFRTDAARSMAAYEGERERSKYKVRIGVSLLDYGQITYKDQGRTEYTDLNGSILVGNFANRNLNEILSQDFESNGVTREGDLTVALPTSLQFNIDYKAYRDLYLNIEYNQTMVEKEDSFNNNRINHLTITPRFERKNIAAFLPVSFSPLGGTAIGTGIRVGPIMLGSGSILSNLFLKEPKNINFFAALRIVTHHVGRRR
ncbi:hypothetical protein CLV90_0552 [Maribacter spongiicola]|uniref:DUF5723 domain-containing protein n=1 Tax=Maribacter spongiicola TaxID=1206753 RepID=A0A4R7K6M2_9FLAO|nr:DUF5723 family protein [Maribacter spongiicola]TDT46499.1 hypothetical protein CLV90_0552 [Maribacter spongiicola]